MKKRCAIIGTGPSAIQHDLSKIDDFKIGVNWSYLGTPSDIHVVTNHVLIKKHGHELDKLVHEAERIYSNQPVNGAFVPKTTLRYCNWQEYKARPTIPQIPKDYDIERDGWVFAGGGPCALQIALSHGFEEIVFVGLDLETGINCHFYEPQKYLDKSVYSGFSRKKLDQAWEIQASYFMAVVPELMERGINFMNTGKSPLFYPVRFEELWA